MRQRHPHNFLFRLACDGLKILAILFTGFIAACLFLTPFGLAVEIEGVMYVALPFFFRLTICLFALISLAGFLESLE